MILIMLGMVMAAPAQRGKRRTQQRKPTKKEQLQQQRQQVQQQQQNTRRRQQQLEQQVGQRLKDVQAIKGEIASRQMLIDSLNNSIDSLNGNIAVLDSQLTVLKGELEERRQHYIKSVRYMYRNRNLQNQMLFVLSASNFNQMYRRMRFMNEYTTYQRAQGEAVKQKSEQVSAKLNELSTARNKLQTLMAKGQEERKQLEARQAEEQRLVAELQKEQQTVRKLIEQQQREEAALTAQIDRIIAEELERARRAEEERQRRLAEQRRQEELRRQQQAQAQAQTQRGRTASTGRRGKRGSTAAATTSRRTTTTTASTAPSAPATATAFHDADPDRRLSGSFASNKGRLPVPITGDYRVVRNYGPYSIAGVSLYSSSIHLEGKAGALARSVFEGKVSSIFNPGSGYVVMVRHGRYISVYSNLVSVNVSMGQKVTINQILGTVGSNHVLQFRLQNWKDTLDPRKWLRRL
jgi:septal ring factor EnvC (AmiA/AmiB activator)